MFLRTFSADLIVKPISCAFDENTSMMPSKFSWKTRFTFSYQTYLSLNILRLIGIWSTFLFSKNGTIHCLKLAPRAYWKLNWPSWLIWWLASRTINQTYANLTLLSSSQSSFNFSSSSIYSRYFSITRSLIGMALCYGHRPTVCSSWGRSPRLISGKCSS